MKRSDIKAGVVYAVKSAYGPPGPIVFLEDGAAGLYQRDHYSSKVKQLAESKFSKAGRGGAFESGRGYAAVVRDYAAPGPGVKADPLPAMRALDCAAELERFRAGERPSAAGLRFEIVTSLNQVAGLYDEELAAYEARREAERAANRRKQAENKAARDRADAILDRLNALGVDGEAVSKGREPWSHICISVADAEKFLALLRDREA
jgi:hypothetical protein